MTLALILKEWKALGRWALLAGLLIGLGLVGVLFGNRPTTIVNEEYLMTTGAAFWGAALVAGLGVMLGDLRRGHFAFAVFRPMPRWRIFLAKFIAASLLYGVTTTIAVVIGTSGASQSRLTYRPFDIAMVRPTLFLQIAGLAWVACGMFIAARRASWIGSRLFPVILPVAAAALSIVYFSSFTAAVLVMLATAAVLLAVGAAFFTVGGEFRSLAWWARPVVGLCVLGSVGAIIAGGFGIAGEVLTNAFGGRTAAYAGGFRNEYYLVGDNGQVVRAVNDNNGSTFFDLDGNPVPQPAMVYAGHEYSPAVTAATRPDEVDVLQQRGMLSIVDTRDPETPYYYDHRRSSFFTPENYVTPVWASGTQELTWYYVNVRRTIEAYDAEGRYVGCLGPDGTFDTTGHLLPFPPDTRRLTDNGNAANGRVLYSDTKAYLVAPDARTVTTIFTSTPDEPILDATMLYVNSDPGWRRFANREPIDVQEKVMRPRVAATTPGKLHVQSPDGTSWMVLPLPRISYPYLNFTAYPRRGPTTPDLVLLTSQSTSDQSVQALTLRDGKMTQQELPGIRWPEGPPRMWTADLIAAAAPPALLGLKLYHLLTASGLTVGEKLRLVPGFFRSPGDALFLGGLLVGLVGTALLARRYRLNRRTTLTWLGLAALFGIHVPLTLVCLRERPAKAKCPACGKKRPIEEPTCPHCGAAWPVPSDPATDVIETTRAA